MAKYLVTAEQGNINLTGQGNLTLEEAIEVAKEIVDEESEGTIATVWECYPDNPYDADFGVDYIRQYGSPVGGW